MSTSDTGFTGAIPDIYDDYLVPMIFRHYANDMADRVAGSAPGTVLETAAGSGVVTRALDERLDADARMTVTDLNPPMIDQARRRQDGTRQIAWQTADALALPFPDAAFDAVCCQFGVMFFPDRVAGLAEARRVLRPGGMLVWNTWDRIDANEFADTVTNALAELFPGDPPRFLVRTPHGYHDKDQIAADMGAAGFPDFTIETVPARSPAANHAHPAIAYCQGTPLRNELEARDAARLAEFTQHAADAVAARFGEGASDALMQAHIITARA